MGTDSNITPVTCYFKANCINLALCVPRIPIKPTGCVRNLDQRKNVTSRETYQLLKEQLLSMFNMQKYSKPELSILSLEWFPPTGHLEVFGFTQIGPYNPNVPWLACQRGWDEAHVLVMLELATWWELRTGVGDQPNLASCLAVVALTWTSLAGLE